MPSTSKAHKVVVRNSANALKSKSLFIFVSLCYSIVSNTINYRLRVQRTKKKKNISKHFRKKVRKKPNNYTLLTNRNQYLPQNHQKQCIKPPENAPNKKLRQTNTPKRLSTLIYSTHHIYKRNARMRTRKCTEDVRKVYGESTENVRKKYRKGTGEVEYLRHSPLLTHAALISARKRGCAARNCLHTLSSSSLSSFSYYLSSVFTPSTM